MRREEDTARPPRYGFPVQNIAKKILDTGKASYYTHIMLNAKKLTVAVLRTAAWRIDAVAEGGSS